MQINDAYFRPQGLFCLIMTYQPAKPNAPVATFDLQNTLAKTVPGEDADWARKFKSSFAPSQGTTEGAMQMPEAAPLVYPQLDAAGEGEKKNVFKRGSAFVTDYFDRRAQATHVGPACVCSTVEHGHLGARQ